MGKNKKLDNDKMARTVKLLANMEGLLAFTCSDNLWSEENWGGFMLVDPARRAIVAGEHFDLTAEMVMGALQVVRRKGNGDNG